MIRSFILITLVALAGCKKKSVDDQAGPPGGTEGARCGKDYDCYKPLVCGPKSKVCVKPGDPELLAHQVAQREAERAADKAFLEKSGVPTPAEQPPPPAAPAEAATAAADAVRVVKVANEGTSSFAFAACTTSERLVGGSCIIDENVLSTVDGYPSDHGATDTIGARWNCGKKTPYKRRLIAYALCQRIKSP